MPKTNSTIAPLYGGHTKTTQTVEASDHPTIRDRSANQRALPIEKPARPFVSRCFEVKLPCVSKMVYIALAHRCKVWTEGDTGTTGRIGRSGIAADAGLTLTTLKVHLSILVSAGLVSIKRTGRTNNYTVRVPSSALKESNRSTTAKRTGHQCHLQTGEPWKAAGVSRRTWYRDRARTDPKTTHGGVRPSGQVALASGTDGQAHGPSDGQAHGPSTKGGSQGVQRTQRRAREEPRQTCPDCGRSWPAEFGTVCHQCGSSGKSNPPERATTPDTTPSCYRSVRNCPQCHTLERGHDDTCQHCDWTREAWDARGPT